MRLSIWIGDEYDVEAQRMLAAALRDAGARRLCPIEGHGGSQEIRRWWYRIGWRVVRVEAETYAGLTIHGPAATVAALAARVSTTQAVPR